MRVLLAPDSFKGTLTAAEVAHSLARGLRGAAGEVVIDELPLSDGGEGLIDTALRCGYHQVPLVAAGALGVPRPTRYARRGSEAIIEMAECCGIQQVVPSPSTAGGSTSLGVGQAIAHALDAGATNVVIGVGGSASTDGGAGLLAGLGAVGLGADLTVGGGALIDVRSVDLDPLHPGLRRTRIVLASDVDNPLLGDTGAARVYGPQKGADAATVAQLEQALEQWVAALTSGGRPDARELARSTGAGAGGGTGFGALLVGAHYRPGVAHVLALTNFKARAAQADLIITGEGRLDGQTLHGKAPYGVARAAAGSGVPVIAVCGQNVLEPEHIRTAGFSEVHALYETPPASTADSARLLTNIGAQIGARWRIQQL